MQAQDVSLETGTATDLANSTQDRMSTRVGTFMRSDYLDARMG